MSCKSQYELLLKSNDVQAKYDAAFNFFNAKKYTRAASLFESLSVLTSGTPKQDTVQYYWGLSNYRYKDYYTAETNFSKFLESYPSSPFAADARYLKIDCLFRQTLRYELDQTPTRRAIMEIKQFKTECPDSGHEQECDRMLKELSDRLDLKALESAKLYYKMEEYRAARVALKNVLKDNADNIYREEVLYYTAMSSYKYAHLSVAKKQKERYLALVDDLRLEIGRDRTDFAAKVAIDDLMSPAEPDNRQTAFQCHAYEHEVELVALLAVAGTDSSGKHQRIHAIHYLGDSVRVGDARHKHWQKSGGGDGIGIGDSGADESVGRTYIGDSHHFFGLSVRRCRRATCQCAHYRN
jgi:outer membrane protein assembly factor BamD